MNSISKIVLKINSTIDEEIKNMPPEYFKSELSRNGYKTGYLQDICYEKWNCFTKAQFVQMSVDDLSYVNEESLVMLYEKFKNEKKSSLFNKQILDKSLQIESIPIQLKFLSALRMKKAREEKLEVVIRNKELLNLFNDEDENVLVPFRILRYALDRRSNRFSQKNFYDFFQPLVINPDKSEAHWKNIEPFISFKKHKEYIKKKDMLRIIESSAKIPCQLDSFPDIVDLDTFCNKFNIDAYRKNFRTRMWVKIQSQEIQAFQIAKIHYFFYEDLVLELARS